MTKETNINVPGMQLIVLCLEFFSSDRENTSRRTCNAGCEHPEYEVAAFTLNR